MAVGGTSGVLYGVVDEVGIDVDRFRLAQGAAAGRLYLTGIEFALAAAGWLATRFLSGLVRGLKDGAEEAGLDPEKIGERLGRWTVRELDQRVDELRQRATTLLSARPEDVRRESAVMAAEIEETLRAVGDVEAELPEPARGRGVTVGRAALAAALTENGFARERAEELAERITVRLREAAVRPAAG